MYYVIKKECLNLRIYLQKITRISRRKGRILREKKTEKFQLVLVLFVDAAAITDSVTTRKNPEKYNI
jgi:hypothetical protein